MWSLKGRMTRRAYILVNVFLFLLPASLGTAFEKQISDSFDRLPDAVQFILVILLLIALVWVVWNIGIRMPVRRLHDQNLSGAYWFAILFLNMVPYVGAVVVFLWLGFAPGTKGSNLYGGDPRGPRGKDVVAVFDGPAVTPARRDALSFSRLWEKVALASARVG